MVNYKTLSDNKLLQLLKESDHSAFNEIYHRYFQLLYIHANKKLSDEELAKDIVQDVFTALWSKRDFDLHIKDLAAYLFTSARNKIFDLFAHHQVQQKHMDSLQDFLTARPVISTDHAIREAQFKAYVDQEIQKLPNKMRIVFLKSRKDGLSYKEIAEELATTENNVSKQVNNALKILKIKLSLLMVFFL